ncbi:hypothetical protein FQN57_005959 [Myotisia sp. PD_48]|nr:hypothetical protein FQN57_005959 [Myotisia sp. PD_48]
MDGPGALASYISNFLVAVARSSASSASSASRASLAAAMADPTTPLLTTTATAAAEGSSGSGATAAIPAVVAALGPEELRYLIDSILTCIFYVALMYCIMTVVCTGMAAFARPPPPAPPPPCSGHKPHCPRARI